MFAASQYNRFASTNGHLGEQTSEKLLKEKFSIWYSEQLFKQFENQSDVPLEDVTVVPVDLSLGNMRNIGAKWLVEAAKYISDNPQFIVNGMEMLIIK